MIVSISEPNSDRSTLFVRSHNDNISRPIRSAPKLCDLTSVTIGNNQTITTGKPPLHPIAAVRSTTSTQATLNGKPNIPPNRPNVQPVQLQKDMRNGTNYPNKLRNKQTAVMDMCINPNAGPRGKFRRARFKEISSNK